MKNKKARWCEPGAEHIVDLRVLHLNQKWQAFFLMLSALRVILNLRHITYRKI